MSFSPTYKDINDVFKTCGYPLDIGGCKVISQAVANKWNQHQAVVNLAMCADGFLHKHPGMIYNAKQMRLLVWKAKENGFLDE
jgi:hypothetical protein